MYWIKYIVNPRHNSNDLFYNGLVWFGLAWFHVFLFVSSVLRSSSLSLFCNLQLQLYCVSVAVVGFCFSLFYFYCCCCCCCCVSALWMWVYLFRFTQCILVNAFLMIICALKWDFFSTVSHSSFCFNSPFPSFSLNLIVIFFFIYRCCCHLVRFVLIRCWMMYLFIYFFLIILYFAPRWCFSKILVGCHKQTISYLMHRTKLLKYSMDSS